MQRRIAIPKGLSAAAHVIPLALLLVSCGCGGQGRKTVLDRMGASSTPQEASEGLTFDLGGVVRMETVLIPAGTFAMGSGRHGSDEEKPVHEVTISQSFYLGKYPVTQEQWQAIMGDDPSRFRGAKRPVDGVSWDDAQGFCRLMGTKIGRMVRLPTEAEWEFACRAGSTTDYCFGDGEAALGEYAWYERNAGGTTHDVGTKRPNAWGLHDMHGNVWEWCQDWYDPRYYAESPRVDPQGPARSEHGAHVLRGGAWHVEAPYCRSASRGGDFPCGEGGPGSWSDAGRSGFRVVVHAANAP